MATDPKFASTPRLEIAQISTANTNRDGTGTIASVITGVAAGTRVERVRIVATVQTTAGVVRLFLSLDGGTTWRLFAEFLVTAITPSTTVEVFSVERAFSDLVLDDVNAVLGAATHNAETFNVTAMGADLT